MPQDHDSGERAMHFGHSMAKKVADYLGAKLIEPGKSNKATWNNRKIVIKSASLGNSQIGVTTDVLNWADAIVAAIQDEDSKFTLYDVSSSWYRSEMKPSRQPHVKMVRTSAIRSTGKKLGRISI